MSQEYALQNGSHRAVIRPGRDARRPRHEACHRGLSRFRSRRLSRSIDEHHQLNTVVAHIEAAQGLFKRRAITVGYPSGTRRSRVIPARVFQMTSVLRQRDTAAEAIAFSGLSEAREAFRLHRSKWQRESGNRPLVSPDRQDESAARRARRSRVAEYHGRALLRGSVTVTGRGGEMR